MNQHRSSAIRALVGGALAAALGAASAAWACTPQAVLNVKEVGRSETPAMSRLVELTVSHTEPSVDGEIVIAEGNVLVDAEVTPIERAPMVKGRAVKVQKVVTLTVAGYHYFSSWTTDGTSVIESSVRTGAYLVQPAPAAVDEPPVVEPPVDPLVATPLNAVAGPTGPVSDTRPTPGAVTSPEAPVQPSERSQAPSPAGAPAASWPVAAAPTAAVTPAGQTVREPASADPSPAVSTRSLGFQAPDASSLWSGLDPSRARSLLDGPAPEGDSGRIPVGSGLLALGLLSLGGVAAVAGRQRLAAARLAERG